MKKFLLCVLATLCLLGTYGTDLTENDAKKIIKNFGHDQGYCLLFGKGKSALALAKQSRLYIHAITTDKKSIQAERLLLANAHVSESACIILQESPRLPYADNLINLIVIPKGSATKTSFKEISRVCAPRGTILLHASKTKGIETLKAQGYSTKKDGPWIIMAKPVNPGFGGWTHIKAGPDLSYVSKDTEVAPWKEIRWVGGPLWGSLYSSYSGLVSGGGIIYYKESAATPKTRLNPRGRNWYLISRDAYNGFEYWRLSIGGVIKYFRNPDYTMCCDEQNIYLREGNTFIARNGLSGKVVKKYTTGFAPTYATISGNTLIISNKVKSIGIDKKTGKLLWERKSSTHPAALSKSAFILTKDTLESIDFTSGKSKWKVSLSSPTGMIPSMLAKGDNVYVSFKKKWKSDRILLAFNIKTGKQIWSRDKDWGEGSQYGTLPFKGKIWLLSRSNKKRTETVGVKVLDTKTGKIDKDFRIPGNVMGKCWGVRSTPNYFLYSNGWFYDKKKNKGYSNNSTRSPCRLGQHPANGLTYFMPHHCDCQVSLRGFLALSKKGKINWEEASKASALTKGSASVTKQIDKNTDWPMFKSNRFRSNFTPQTIKGDLKKIWSHQLGKTPLTQATGAYGMIFVAQIKSHQVFALDEKTGEKKWIFVADGAITAPPSLSQGYCLISTSSGYVHCLNAKDGKEIWKFKAAPAQKYIGVKGKLDSPWPVQGGVYIHKGNAYFSAGLATTQSVGFYLFGLNMATGKTLWKLNLKGKATYSGDMFLSDDKQLSYLSHGYDFLTGKINKRYKAPISMLRTTRYLTTVSLIDYAQSIEPQRTDKRHVYLFDGRLKGDILASSPETSIAAGRYSTSFPGWKKKYGQFFIHAKGASNWELADITHQTYGLVLTNNKVFSVGIPRDQDLNKKSELWVLNAKDGKRGQTIILDHHPVYDGLSVSNGQLIYTTRDGHIICYGH